MYKPLYIVTAVLAAIAIICVAILFSCQTTLKAEKVEFQSHTYKKALGIDSEMIADSTYNMK